MLKAVVDPDSWAAPAGTGSATIHCWAGRLVIVQSTENQRMIAALLEELRALGPTMREQQMAREAATRPATEPRNGK